MAKVGFLGLGIMGYPMARHLLAAGHEVALWSHTGSKAKELAVQGKGVACETPKQVAEQSDVIFLCVGDTAMSEQITLGPDGLADGAKAGTILRRGEPAHAGHEPDRPGLDRERVGRQMACTARRLEDDRQQRAPPPRDRERRSRDHGAVAAADEAGGVERRLVAGLAARVGVHPHGIAADRARLEVSLRNHDDEAGLERHLLHEALAGDGIANRRGAGQDDA